MIVRLSLCGVSEVSGQEEITEFLDHAMFREKVLKGCISRLLPDYL